MRRTLVHTVVLGGFSMAAAALLSSGHWLTRDVIAQRRAEDLAASLGLVLPSALYDNTPATDVRTFSKDDGRTVTVHRAIKDDRVTGIVLTLETPGYGGPISLVIGVDRAGEILGVRVVGHSETPGLGDRIEAAKSDWILQFAGLSLDDPPVDQWLVTKDGGRFDAFTGATVTPRAVLAGIRDGLAFFRARRRELLAQAPEQTG